MYRKAYRIYCRIQEVIVGLSFAGVVFLTFSNALLRTINRPIATTDDISLLLFSWAALLGADVAHRYSRLVGMDMLVNKFPPKWQKSFQILVFAIMITALLLFMRYGFALAFGNWNRFLNTLPISYGWVTLSFPVGACMMTFTTVIKMVKTVSHFKDDSYTVKKDNPDVVGEEYTTGVDDEELIEAAGFNKKAE